MIRKMKGTEDLLPNETYRWQYLEDTARMLFDSYNFQEIRTPLFESFDLFSRSVGETTDIVSKEMYDFYDKGNRHIALRPEGTAPVVRAYVEHKLFGPEHPQPLKVYYMGPMFRYERPQAGRQRQFHQIGVEVFGSTNPATDAETIALAWNYLQELGVEDLTLYINSLGTIEDRANYRQALVEYFTPLKDQLSPESQNRLEDNPLRILDSKNPDDQALVDQAPKILDYINDDSKKHFDSVQSLLTALKIPFKVDPLIVRGLDYYQDTIFEIMVQDKGIGAQSTVCGGGRYDGLVESLGGPQTPGFGFGLGMERLLLLLDKEEVEIPQPEGLDVFIVGLGQEVNEMSLRLVQAARQDGLIADRDFLNRSLRSQFRTADRQKAKTTIVLGENELNEGQVTIKNQETNKERQVKISDLLDNFLLEFQKSTTDTSVIDSFFKGE